MILLKTTCGVDLRAVQILPGAWATSITSESKAGTHRNARRTNVVARRSENIALADTSARDPSP